MGTRFEQDIGDSYGVGRGEEMGDLEREGVIGDGRCGWGWEGRGVTRPHERSALSIKLSSSSS
jgi:hypothetical protein